MYGCDYTIQAITAVGGVVIADVDITLCDTADVAGAIDSSTYQVKCC